MKSVLPYFHPTCVALLSPSQQNLAKMSQLLPDRPWGWSYRIYEDPQQALEEINAQDSCADLLQRYGTAAGSAQGQHIELDLRRLYEEIYRPQRLQKVSVLLVDADTHLQPCDWFVQLRDPAVQRLCFGELPQHNKVLQLLRQRHFDQFIYTNHKESKTQLQQSLQFACERYFDQSTASLQRLLQQCIPDTAMLDPFFADFFYEKLQDLKIAEYALYMPQLAFVLFDIYAKQFGLFVKLPQQLEADRQSPQAARLPQKTQEKMRMRETMLCYAMRNEHPLPDSSEWPSLMRETKTFWGQQAYYAAARRDVLTLDEDKDIVLFDPYKYPSLQQQQQQLGQQQKQVADSDSEDAQTPESTKVDSLSETA